MPKLINNNHIPHRLGASKMVTVSVTMCLDEATGDTTALKNAAEAIEFHINTNPRQHKVWVKTIEVI